MCILVLDHFDILAELCRPFNGGHFNAYLSLVHILLNKSVNKLTLSKMRDSPNYFKGKRAIKRMAFMYFPKK